MRAVDLSIYRMIFPETSHALDLCLNQTKMKLRSFHRSSLAEFTPMFLDGILIEFGEFAESQVKGADMFRIQLARPQKRFRKDGLGSDEFAR